MLRIPLYPFFRSEKRRPAAEVIRHQRLHALLGAPRVGTVGDDTAVALKLRRNEHPQQRFVDVGAARRAEKHGALVNLALHHLVEIVLKRAARAAVKEQHGLLVVREDQVQNRIRFVLHRALELEQQVLFRAGIVVSLHAAKCRLDIV